MLFSGFITPCILTNRKSAFLAELAALEFFLNYFYLKNSQLLWYDYSAANFLQDFGFLERKNPSPVLSKFVGAPLRMRLLKEFLLRSLRNISV